MSVAPQPSNERRNAISIFSRVERPSCVRGMRHCRQRRVADRQKMWFSRSSDCVRRRAAVCLPVGRSVHTQKMNAETPAGRRRSLYDVIYRNQLISTSDAISPTRQNNAGISGNGRPLCSEFRKAGHNNTYVHGGSNIICLVLLQHTSDFEKCRPTINAL